MVYSGFLASDLIDSRTNLVDTWLNWDGEPSDKITAVLQVRTTTDNPSGSPTWTAWQPLIIGDFLARGYEFRVIVTSTDSTRNIDISTLSISIDIPDRNERAVDVTVTTSGLNVTYANAFKDIPFLGITGRNMQTDEYWTLTNETRTGFSIIIYNTSGAVERKINWIATGYGRAV